MKPDLQFVKQEGLHHAKFVVPKPAYEHRHKGWKAVLSGSITAERDGYFGYNHGGA